MIARDMIHPSAAGHAIITHMLSDVIAETQTPLPREKFDFGMFAYIILPVALLVCVGFLLLYLRRRKKPSFQAKEQS